MSEEVFAIKKVKNNFLQTCVISDHHAEKIFGTFYEKNPAKTKSKRVWVEKVIK